MRLFLLSLLFATLTASLQVEPSLIDVPFEYKIEVDYSNPALLDASIGEALQKLENFAFTTLTALLGDNAPVEILEIISAQVGSCSSTTLTNDASACSIFESSVSLAVDSGTDEVVVHRAILEEIQSFVKGFNADNPGIDVTFIGPFVVNSDLIIRLDNVNRIMNEEEIAIFESVLVNLLDPLADGISLTSTTVYLQQLISPYQGRRRLQTTGDDDGTYNDVFVRADGACKDCSSGDFGTLMNDAVGSSAGDIQKELIKKDKGVNGGGGTNDDGDNYFEDTTVSVIAQAQGGIPDGANDGDDINSLDLESMHEFPYWVLIALGVGVFVVSVGVCYVGYLSRNARLAGIAKLRETSRKSAASDTSRAEEEEEDTPMA